MVEQDYIKICKIRAIRGVFVLGLTSTRARLVQLDVGMS
jgi:hypothetical protein